MAPDNITTAQTGPLDRNVVLRMLPVRSEVTAFTLKLNIAHIVAIVFVSVIMIVSLFLGKAISILIRVKSIRKIDYIFFQAHNIYSGIENISWRRVWANQTRRQIRHGPPLVRS